MARNMVRQRVDLKAAEQMAAGAVRAAGVLLRDGARGTVAMRQKDPSGDVVTDLEITAERLIVDRILEAYPDHQIVAEEAGVSGVNETWSWFVDPLDGTNNLAIGLSAYVVGVALCRDRRPVVSVVHDPVADRTWSAVSGQGARFDGRRLRPAPRTIAAAPVVAWTQGHAVGRGDSTACTLKVVLDASARRVLQLWAPLLGWVMLARGDIDGIVGYEPEAVDLPAGVLLAAETGMVIRRLDGTPFDDRADLPAASRSFVAGPPDTIDRLTKLVADALYLEPRVAALGLARTAW